MLANLIASSWHFRSTELRGYCFRGGSVPSLRNNLISSSDFLLKQSLTFCLDLRPLPRLHRFPPGAAQSMSSNVFQCLPMLFSYHYVSFSRDTSMFKFFLWKKCQIKNVWRRAVCLCILTPSTRHTHHTHIAHNHQYEKYNQTQSNTFNDLYALSSAFVWGLVLRNLSFSLVFCVHFVRRFHSKL